jgi:hypothetical protein
MKTTLNLFWTTLLYPKIFRLLFVLYGLLGRYRLFRETYYLHLQGWKLTDSHRHLHSAWLTDFLIRTGSLWIMIFWVVTPCSRVGGYQLLRRWRQYGAPKTLLPLTRPHGVTTQKIITHCFTAVKTADLIWLTHCLSDYQTEQSTNSMVLGFPSASDNIFKKFPVVITWKFITVSTEASNWILSSSAGNRIPNCKFLNSLKPSGNYMYQLL